MRREGDSNPRIPYEIGSLANYWFQPLTHPSKVPYFYSFVYQSLLISSLKRESKSNNSFSFETHLFKKIFHFFFIQFQAIFITAFFNSITHLIYLCQNSLRPIVMTKKTTTLLLAAVLLLLGCTPQPKVAEKQKNILNIRETAGTMNLHPLIILDELSGIVSTYMFQTLTSIDFKTLEITPLLVKSAPNIYKTPNGLTHYEFTIRDEAKWDNGKAIIASDVEFSLKLNLLPDPTYNSYNAFYESIVEFRIDSLNEKKFTLISTMDQAKSTFLVGDIIILPPYVYDPSNVLNQYTIPQLTTDISQLENDSIIIEFMSSLNDVKYKSDPNFIVGSGPYQVTEIIDGQSLKLEKKQQWWGDSINSTNTEFDATIDQIQYHIIPDETTALSALKNGAIDLMRGISPKEFSEMNKSNVYTDKLNFVTSPIMAYYSLGLNQNHPILKTKNNRKALAYLLDVKKIIDIVAYGYGEQIIGPNAKADKKNYNFDLEPYSYDFHKATELLDIEGWKDSDGDGVLDKVINGVKTPFEIEYNYNSGNESRKKIGLIFQEDAKKAGIKITIKPLEWSNFLNQLNNKNFEMAFVGKIFSPVPRDHRNVFHSESIIEGLNYVSFSNKEADQLIDLINQSTTVEDRAAYNHKLQEILHEELPYLFLYAPLERMAINKQFTNYNLSPMRPGFWAPGFKPTN